MNQNPANAIKDTMWRFLMDGGQQANIPALKEYVYDLIQITTQKSAGQNEKLQAKGHIPWENLDMTTALVLSGELDQLNRENAELKRQVQELERTNEILRLVIK